MAGTYGSWRHLCFGAAAAEARLGEKVRELVRAEMCGAYDLDPPLAVDVGVGDNWAEAKS